MCFLLMLFTSLIIGIKSMNTEKESSLEKGKEYLSQGYLTEAKRYARESKDDTLIKEVNRANSIYQLATSNKTSLEYSMMKYLELIDICNQSKQFHMEALNISLRLNNDTLFDSIYKKLRIIAPEDVEVLAMKGFKNLKNTEFSKAKTYFNEYKKQSPKYSQIVKDIDMLDKSLKGSIYFLSKNQTEKSLKFLQKCQKIMQKYSISEDSILSKKIRKIDIDVYILTQKYEEAVKEINKLISKTNNDDYDEFLFIKRGNILYIHKDYSGCISDFEKAIEITKDENIKQKLQIYLNNAKKLQEEERKIGYYSVLELNPGADINEVKKSYRKLAILWHPDRYKEILKKKEAEKKMKLINRAFDIIGNEETKHIYDFCHQYTDVPPVFEDKRGFFSKLFDINKENVWNKCYEDDYQFTESHDNVPNNSTEEPTFTDDLFKSNENSDDQFDESDFEDSAYELYYPDLNEKSDDDSANENFMNSSESGKDIYHTIFRWMLSSIVVDITRNIISTFS